MPVAVEMIISSISMGYPLHFWLYFKEIDFFCQDFFINFLKRSNIRYEYSPSISSHNQVIFARMNQQVMHSNCWHIIPHPHPFLSTINRDINTHVCA
ncbi:hypothetical protein ES703_58913 [subsurface metagenome]